MALNKILLSDNVTELAGVKSVVFKEAVNADVNIRPGCVGSASIEVEVYGSQATAVSVGDVVYYYQIDKNNVQTLIGEFVCEPTIKTKTSYKFIAYDNAQKLNADFSQWLQANQSNFPMSVYALVSAACSVAGVTLGSSSWGLSTESIQAFYSDGITCRDILSYAAEIGCCFVRCHADGNVYFDWYASNANTIAPSVGTGQYAYKQDGLNYANFTTAALDRVAVHPSGEDDVAYIYPTAITSGNTIHIQNNLLLTGADATLYNAVAQNVYTVMTTLGTYRPMTASLFARENPFRSGDIVSVTDAQGVVFTSIITGMTVSDSGAILESTGNETYGEGTGNVQKTLTQLASDIVRINKLKVDWADINQIFANDITVTGQLHSSDYSYTSGDFADSGMGLDFATKRINTPFFGIDPTGNLFAQGGQIAGFNIYKGNSINKTPSPPSVYKTNGTASTNYTYSDNTLTVGDNGYAIYSMPKTAVISGVTYRLTQFYIRNSNPCTCNINYYDASNNLIGSEVYVLTSAKTIIPSATLFDAANSVNLKVNLSSGDELWVMFFYGNYYNLYTESPQIGTGDFNVYLGDNGISIGKNIILTPDGNADIGTLQLDNPLAIAYGGTGDTAVQSETTAANVITAGSGFSIESVNYRKWGKVAQLYFQAKKSTAQTTEASMTVGTVVSGKRPAVLVGAICTDSSIIYSYVAAGGSVSARGTWAANATKTFIATYILP